MRIIIRLNNKEKDLILKIKRFLAKFGLASPIYKLMITTNETIKMIRENWYDYPEEMRRKLYKDCLKK